MRSSMSASEEAEALRAAVRQELDRLGPEFKRVGLTWTGPDLEVLNQNPIEYTAEVRIWFYKDDEPVDFLEFFVCKDGAPVASEA